ncbi:MAG: UDP-N-acetylmuramoyl-L-alanine--D-glutamate ligase [Stackebrandtia sp.]
MSRYLVAGVGIAGTASAKALVKRGHHVVVYNREESPELTALKSVAARTVVDDDLADELVASVDAVVVSPGFPPHHRLVLAAQAAGVEVYSEPELAWRLRPESAAPWLAVTGTNGKTTTVTMLASVLTAAGLRCAALGNVGEPLVDAVTEDYDVLAVELSSQQLHWSRDLAPQAGAMLNLADDHLSWHGDFDAYVRAKTAVWRGAVNVGNADDPRVSALLSDASATSKIEFTLERPRPGQFGVAESQLVDFTGDRPLPLCPVEIVRPAGDHNVANALAAAALARGHGVPASAVAEGLAAYRPEPHRNVEIAVVDEVRYVDDSKGTNPHATAAAIESYDRIVWIAGGQLKGVSVDALVAAAAPRLRGAVLLGADRDRIGEALTRHAPTLPVVDVARTDEAAMAEAVDAAAALAEPGCVVLLSPAAASYDMFSGYPERGRRFAEAVSALSGAKSSRARP